MFDESSEELELQSQLERRYVGTCLRQPDTAFKHPLGADDLTDPRHERIVGAIKTLHSNGRQVTAATVEHHLTEAGPYRSAGAALTVATLPFDPAVADTAALLRQRGASRRVLAALQPVLDAQGRLPWGEVQNCLQEAASVRADAWGGASLLDPYEAFATHVEGWQAGKTKPFALDGSIDAIVKLKPRTCLVLGAPTNVGKTTTLAYWLREAANSGVGAALISCEDNEGSIGIKWVAADAGLSAVKLRDVELNPEEFRAIASAKERHKNRLLRVVQVADRKLDGVLAAIRQAAALGCKVVGIDYLTAVSYSKAGFTRRDCIDHTLTEILATAYSLDLAVILVSQYSREDKKLSRRKPVLADLKESGTIENAATYVILLWRWKDNDGEDIQGVVAKVKDGPGVGHRVAWRRDHNGNVKSTSPREEKAEDWME